MKKLVFLLGALFFATSTWAFSVPNHQGYVTDQADVFLKREEEALIRKITKIEQETTVEIAILTVNTTGGVSDFDYALETARKWGVGKAENDNGIFILIAKNDRRWRILTGYGVEGVLPDALAKRIGEYHFPSYFRKGQYFLGVANTLDEISKVLKGDIGSVAEDFFPLMEGDGVLTKEEVIRFIEKEGKWSLFCMVLFGIIPFFFKAVNVFDKHKVLQKWIVGWFVFLGLLLSWQKADIMLLGQWFVPMLGIFAAFRWWRPRVKKEKLLKKKIFKTCFGACPFALLVFILLASVFWMGILSVLFFAICLAEEEGVSDGWWNDWTSGTGFGSGGLGGFGGFGGGGFGGGGAGGGW